MNPEKPPYVILGCGYTGTRLAQALLRDGHPVRVCARRAALLEPLRALGADVHYLDASKPRQFGPALRGFPQPVVVYSIPGVFGLPLGEAVRRAAEAANQAKARAFIYLSTTGVYGRNELQSNDEWVDEETPVDIHDIEMTSRVSDEAAVGSLALAGLRTVILRLSAIYGPPLWPGQSPSPGRGVRQRLRKGEYKLWDGGRYYFSRIHVDDLVQVIRAAAERARPGSIYVVGDDYPCPQGEYGRWLAAHLGLPEPPSEDSLRPEAPRQVIRGRRISNRKMKEEMGITLRYPTFREGEAQIDEVEGGGASVPPLPLGEEPGVRGEPAPAPAPWPSLMRPGEMAERMAELGIALRELLPGQGDGPGQVRVVLSGTVETEWQGRSGRLSPLDIAPEGAALKNPGPGPALVLALGGGAAKRDGGG